MITFFLICKGLFTEVKFSCRKLIKISHCVEPLISFLCLGKVELDKRSSIFLLFTTSYTLMHLKLTNCKLTNMCFDEICYKDNVFNLILLQLSICISSVTFHL